MCCAGRWRRLLRTEQGLLDLPPFDLLVVVVVWWFVFAAGGGGDVLGAAHQSHGQVNNKNIWVWASFTYQHI